MSPTKFNLAVLLVSAAAATAVIGVLITSHRDLTEAKRVEESITSVNSDVTAGAITEITRDGHPQYTRCTSGGWCFTSAHQEDLDDEVILPSKIR